jgi:hypothetical protein
VIETELIFGIVNKEVIVTGIGLIFLIAFIVTGGDLIEGNVDNDRGILQGFDGLYGDASADMRVHTTNDY